MAPEIEPAVARRSRRCKARRLFLERHPPPRTEGRPLVSPGISGVWGRPANLCEMVGVPMAFGMGHGFSQVYSAGIRLLSGLVAHERHCYRLSRLACAASRCRVRRFIRLVPRRDIVVPLFV